MLADLHMPGALEALDAILHGVDGATLTAAEAIEQLLDAQISCATTDTCRPRCGPVACPPSSGSPSLIFPSSRRFVGSRWRVSTSSASSKRREDVVFLGPPGVGKTHLAISLAIAAPRSGRRVYYGTLADLITSLEKRRPPADYSRA
jgi:hypothetical protein